MPAYRKVTKQENDTPKGHIMHFIDLLRETAEYSRERFDKDGVMVSVTVEPFADGMTIKAEKGDARVEKLVSFEDIESARSLRGSNILLAKMPNVADQVAE